MSNVEYIEIENSNRDKFFKLNIEPSTNFDIMYKRIY